MRATFVLSEVGAGLRRNLTMTVASILNITITLTLLGGALMIRNGADRLQHDVLSQLEVSVFLNQACGTPNAPTDCLTPAQRTSVQKTLEGLPEVEQVTYISSASAMQRFKDDFAGDKALLKEVPPGSLPESFAVKLKNPRQYALISSAVSQAPGVHEVDNGSSALKKLFNFFHKITLGALAIAVLLLLSTGLLIYNTMRVAAFSRRRETGIMRLVGASDFYIQAPFVLEGTFAGIAGSGVALLLLLGVKEFLSSTLSTATLKPFGEWSTFIGVVPAVAIIGILFPAIASYLTLQRHLRV
jgi:cell division transport system permease protein